VEQAENHKKGPRGSWAGNHMGNVSSWLNLIRDHIATSLSIEPDDLELSPFNQRGGLGKAHQLFGEQLPKLIDELNETLAA
jgi:type I restriction enzyme R subunit